MALKVKGITDRLWKVCHFHGLDVKWRSQRAFAAEYGLDSTKLSEWLRGTQPDLEGLEQFRKAFGVPISWLLVGEDGAAEALKWWNEGGGRAGVGQARGDPRPKPGDQAGALKRRK